MVKPVVFFLLKLIGPCSASGDAQPATDAAFNFMEVCFGLHVDGNRPHGAGLGAFAAKRAFLQIELR